MNRRRVAGCLTVVVVASLALAPAAVAAGRAGGGGGVGGVGHNSVAVRLQSSVGRPGHIVPASQFTRQWYPSGHHGSPHGGGHSGRGFNSVGFVSAPAIIYAPSPFLYGSAPAYEPAVYYDQPMTYAPPTVSTVSLAPPPPPAPPTPSVVQFPTGRYELRGDGSTSPYTWVWIPNPPPAPPSAPPADPPASVDSSRTRLSRLYHWTDEEGVVHWTDRLDAVPQRYRAEAKPPER